MVSVPLFHTTTLVIACFQLIDLVLVVTPLFWRWVEG